MAKKVFAFHRSADGGNDRRNGGLRLFIPAPREQLEQTSGRLNPMTGVRTMTNKEYRERILRAAEASALRAGGDPATIIEIAEDKLPHADYDYRDAWALNGKRVEVDMAKAKEVHRNRIRKFREKAWLALAIAERLAEGEKLTAVRAEKQRLRDLPAMPEIEACTTCAELRALEPEELVSGERAPANA